MNSCWIKGAAGLGLVAAAVTIGVMLAPYIIGALLLWLAWKWTVGSSSDLPESAPGQLIDATPIQHREIDLG